MTRVVDVMPRVKNAATNRALFGVSDPASVIERIGRAEKDRFTDRQLEELALDFVLPWYLAWHRKVFS